MERLIRRSKELYRTEGLTGLVSGICRFIWFYTPLRELFWSVRTVLARGQVMLRIEGVQVTFRVSTKLEMIRFSTFVGERKLLEDILREVGNEDVFWDVGANVGLFTCFAGRKGATTVAFEPEPTNVSRLRENVLTNGVECEVLELALGSSSGTVELAIRDQGEGGVHAVALGGEDKTVPVSIERGDKLVEAGEAPKPTVIKIDVEGAEADVLDGLRTTLRDDECRLVYVEVHAEELNEFGWTESDIHRMLKEAGFDVDELIRRTETAYHLRASKSPQS